MSTGIGVISAPVTFYEVLRRTDSMPVLNGTGLSSVVKARSGFMEIFIYEAYSTARVSRITTTLIFPG
jgi:hypothetical protein